VSDELRYVLVVDSDAARAAFAFSRSRRFASDSLARDGALRESSIDRSAAAAGRRSSAAGYGRVRLVDVCAIGTAIERSDCVAVSRATRGMRDDQ
jgi:hypothetical protein